MTSASSARTYHERLWPSVGMLVMLLLFIPAIALVMIPINADIALIVAIAVYVLLAGSLSLMSPVLRIEDGVFSAGRARIPVAALGRAEVLDNEQLKRAIGPGLDARAYLVVRGWIHGGIRIENIDPADPAPYWVLTTRRPEALIGALRNAREHAAQ